MRGIFIGVAVACYAAAVIITLSGLGLPVSNPITTARPDSLPPALEPPSAPPAAPEPSRTGAESAITAFSPPSRSEVGTVPEGISLLQRAQKSLEAGDLKRAENLYLLLLRINEYREIAAQKLGKLYFNAGDYRRAEEMYRESARVLRERSNPAHEPLSR